MTSTPPTTTLPSIQFLLTQQSTEDKKFTRGHRSARSVSSLPSELQNLSLNGPSQLVSPAANSTTTSIPLPKDDLHIVKPEPSWLAGPPPPPAATIMLPSHQRQERTHHQRSISDFSLTAPAASIIPNHTTAFRPIDNNAINSNNSNTNTNNQKDDHGAISSNSNDGNNCNGNNHSLVSSPALIPSMHTPTPPPALPSPLHHQTPYQLQYHHQPQPQHQLQHHRHQHQKHLSHRRAISANTVDHMIRPSSSSGSSSGSLSNAPPVPPLPFYHRAHSNSPPEEYLSLNTTKPQPLEKFMTPRHNKLESTSVTPTSLSSTISSMPTTPASAPMSLASPAANVTSTSVEGSKPSKDGSITSHTVVNGMDLPRDLATGRYLCPYCQKAFSRPSSLRIHTYSHTGEKPFECTECPRRFSVQSNMRRHLRIHLIRPTNKTNF